MYSSSLRLRYSEPRCASRLENPPVYLGQRVDNLTNVGLGGIMSSFRCSKETPAKSIGVATFCTHLHCYEYSVATKDPPCTNFKEDGVVDTITKFHKPDPRLLCAGFE